MIWWFLILGVSTLAVVCVAIALFMRLRQHLGSAQAAQREMSNAIDVDRGPGNPEG